MVYYGEKLLKSGKCVEIVLTAKGDLELREKTGKLIREIEPYEVDRDKAQFDHIIRENDWNPTLVELYKIEVEKPTRAEEFIRNLAVATEVSEIRVRRWLFYGTMPTDKDLIMKIEKYFGLSYSTLFDMDRNIVVSQKYQRHKRTHRKANLTNQTNEEAHGEN